MESTPSPQMKAPFWVSAPGKVIFYGEHAAVAGYPAIAAAISSLRSYLHIKTLSASERTVTLDFKDIGLHQTWEIDSLPWSHVSHNASESKINQSHGDSLDKTLLAAIKPFVESISQNLETKERKKHHSSATAFLYLFLSLGSSQSPGFVYTLRSTVPVGAGLGSSASVSVCMSAALLIQRKGLQGPASSDTVVEELKRINSWAFAGELCIHGDPSGVDNTVSCLGKAVLYRKNVDGGPSTVTPLDDFPKLPLLLVNTKVPRSTVDQVEKVRKLKQGDQEVVRIIFNAIGQIAGDALGFLSSATTDDSEKRRAAIEGLGQLVADNQGLLVSLSVSHPCLDRVKQLAEAAQIGWAKLTGAGGGGCAIILLRPDVSEEAVEGFEQKVAKEGFDVHKVVLGAAGVAVRGRAAFGDSSEEEIEEIDVKKFANAASAIDIELLVGLGGDERGKGWTFWR